MPVSLKFKGEPILNSVSCVDGKRFYANKATYAQMRRVSDDLCRLRGLSVIAQENGRSQHYGQWIAEQAGAPTWMWTGPSPKA